MGLILIGNNAINILAAMVAGIIFARIFGDNAGIWATTLLLTIIMLIFAELTPKTYAAVHPEKIAFFNVYPLAVLMIILKLPIICMNWISNALVRMFGIDPTSLKPTTLSSEDLKIALKTAKDKQISTNDKSLILNAMQLEKINVEDIIIHKNEIYGIDINDNAESIKNIITSSPFTRIAVYDHNLNNILGVLHIKKILPEISKATGSNIFSKDNILKLINKPVFIIDQTSLAQQLIIFREKKERLGFIVNEHGEVQGLITIDNLLEQVVGNYTTKEGGDQKQITKQDDYYIASGNLNIIELNKTTGWEIDAKNAVTVNGFLLEYLQKLPESHLCCKMGNYLFEILELNATGIERVKIMVDD